MEWEHDGEFALYQGVSGGVNAAKAGHEVIMSPTSHCYFDYRQSLKCAPALNAHLTAAHTLGNSPFCWLRDTTIHM